MSSLFPRASATRRSVVVATTLGTCVVCQQEAHTSVAWRHACSSTCCVKCLQFYVALKVSQGLVQSSQLTCPDPRCLTPLDHAEVQACTSDEVFALYQRTLRQETPLPGKAKSHFFQRKKALSSATSSAAASNMALPHFKDGDDQVSTLRTLHDPLLHRMSSRLDAPAPLLAQVGAATRFPQYYQGPLNL
ncbi:hypothetical protein SPRG_03421 [Saprolegnia parasitica CBS 223.65]|uniref:Uncharacterized protein n=1 Tax=Saprolegnia parasitica (strain CBS 223.65) TaxID=695850 RepID=A0A067CNG3_SAPPC|nr:hypothetical protein SPRG_03421 [Saprolegnia parasitica CBS 223.65]KDO32204.1 hypothetical protein SPRG_03421 [Saprolegnia parasitica CBS 223.65]|eukprot:XP_012197384.1 hypothetical protein SPRG_03421 [Saprolegnia parasitica CBS 223.65]